MRAWILIAGGIALVLILAIVLISWTRRKVFFPTCRFVAWFLWGSQLKPVATSTETRHDIESLVGLLAIIIGGTVALGAGIQQTGRVNWWYVILYGVAGLIPLGGMLHFVHTSTGGFCRTAKAALSGKANEETHAYDDTTVAFAGHGAFASSAFMLLSIILVALEMFPGQARNNRVLYPSPELRVVQPPEDTKPRYYLSVPINKSIYEHGIPSDLTPNVRLTGSTLKNWEVYFCRVRDMAKGGATVAETIPYEAPNAPGFFGVILPPLPTDGTLNIDIYLKRRDSTGDERKPFDDEGARTKLSDEVFSKGNLRVIDRPLP